MNPRRWLLVIAFASVLALVWWRLRGDDATTDSPAQQAARDAGNTQVTPSGGRTLSPLPLASPRTFAPPKLAFDATAQHTANPCTTLLEPSIPKGYEQITADSITVAWSPADATGPADSPLRPVALAHLVAGLLDEAAQLTGTERRAELTVIIEASQQDFMTHTHTPQWVSGLYDGAEIRVFVKGSEDLAVALPTLRHEVMHAQLHASAGCMPFWFNEGLAQYFGGVPPLREWLAMLRTGEPFELATVNNPTVLDLKMENALRLYAVSIAMITYLTDHGGEPALRLAVRAIQSIDSPRAAQELWDKLAPKVGYRDVLEALAQKLFKLPLGAELELAMRGPICCAGLHDPTATTCRPGAPRTEPSWSDTSTTPRMFCRQRW